MSDKKKECPGCAMRVDQDAETCSICGYEFPQQPYGMKIAVWVMIILLVLYWVVG